MKDTEHLTSYDLTQSKFQTESEAVAFAVFVQWAEPCAVGLTAGIDLESDFDAPGVTITELMWGFSLLARDGVIHMYPEGDRDLGGFRFYFPIRKKTKRGVFGAAEFAISANVLRDRRLLAECEERD